MAAKAKAIKASMAAQTCNDPVKLISMVTAAGKDMFMVCFSKTDKKTKAKALPLLQKINNVEIAALIYDEVIRPESKGKQGLSDAYMTKLQIQTAKIQDDLAAVKAKMACNENSEKQTIKAEYKQFCDALDDMEGLLYSVDKRIESECKHHGDDKAYNLNMQMIQADIRLLESARGRDKYVAELRELTETRRLTELRLIDAFEVSMMESESRQLMESDRQKKKLEARCVKLEKNHTEIEVAHMELGKERRLALDEYLNDVRQRFGYSEKKKSALSVVPQGIMKKREAEHGAGYSPATTKKRDGKARGILKKKRENGSRENSPKL